MYQKNPPYLCVQLNFEKTVFAQVLTIWPVSHSTNRRNVNHLLEDVGCATNPNYPASMTGAVMALPRILKIDSTRKWHISLCSLQNWCPIRKPIFLLPLEHWPLQTDLQRFHIYCRQFSLQAPKQKKKKSSRLMPHCKYFAQHCTHCLTRDVT